MTPWEVLGLDPDERDERVIKRAYAAKLREHRPDEDPEGFRKVREAYEFLLSYRDYEYDEDDDDDEEAWEAAEPPPPLRATRPRDEPAQEEPKAEPAPPADVPVLREETVRPHGLPPLTPRKVDTRDLPPKHARAVADYLGGRSEPLEELIWELRGEGAVHELEDIALDLLGRARGALPASGAYSLISLATVVAAIRPSTARSLAAAVFEASVEGRHYINMDELDFVIAAAEEITPSHLGARYEMARIVAAGEWDGKMNPEVKSLADAAGEAPKDGAFHAWLKDAAPKLKLHVRIRKRPRRIERLREEEAKESVGCGTWFFRFWLIMFLLRACVGS